MRLRILGLLVAVTAAIVASPAATAQTPAADVRGRKATARAHVDAGLAAHKQGNYQEAIELYERAYLLVPHPALLFNLGQVHRLAGQRTLALARYRRYLKEVPTGDLAEQASYWIERLTRDEHDEQARLEAQARSAEKAAAADAELQRRLHDDRQRQQAEAEATARQRTADRARAAADARRRMRRLWRITGIATASTGAAAVVAAGYFGMRADSISDDLSRRRAIYDPDRFVDGQHAETTMFVLYGVGGALVVGGSLLAALSWGDGGIEVTPAAGDRVGVNLRAAF